MEIGRRLTQVNAALTLVVMAVAAALCSAAGLGTTATAALVVGVGSIAIVAAMASVETAATAGSLAPATVDLVERLALELERSRRHEQPLSVARLPLVERGEAGAAAQYLARSVQASLRTIDETIAEGDSIYLILPGTDRESAELCVQRVAESRPGLFTDSFIRYGTFPEDGVTVAGILQVLDGSAPAAAPHDLPSLDRRRRISLDLRAEPPVASEVDA